MPNTPEVNVTLSQQEKEAVEALAKKSAEEVAPTRSQVEGVLTVEPAESEEQPSTFLGGEAQTAIKAKAKGNTSVGKEALKAVTTGAYNTAVGGGAGAAMTSGSECAAFGHAALNKCTIGGNSAFGKNALAACTTGSSNTAVGNHALETTITGASNTAVGSLALSKTTGANNTAVGFNAAEAVTSGGQNTAVGVKALAAGTTSAENVAIGENTLSNASVKNGNVAIGTNAGSGNEGSENIFIGPAAGHTEKASNKLYIGKGSTTEVLIKGVMSETAASNELTLGTTAGKVGLYGTTPVVKAAEIKVPGAFKTGVSAFETEAEAKAIRDKLTTVIEALKGIGICV